MARQWKGRCTRCRKPISYADNLAQRDASLGRPRMSVCPGCERAEIRGLKPVAFPTHRISGIRETDAMPLGFLEWNPAEHQLEEREPDHERDWFGVKDEEIDQLYAELMREDTPVVIGVAPTGSGKSTFLVHRLLQPESLGQDAITRGRQIVVTQPRRKATLRTTDFVADRLHGADFGIGHEIGYRVSKDHACDWRNRLTYVTDGTLINWLVRGELDRISLVVIDEAHERSRNIDVILALMTRCLPQYPHLKMVIVSATIDHKRFQEHFERCLPGNLRCGIVNCTGENPKALYVQYRKPDVGLLPYEAEIARDFNKAIAHQLAEAIVRLVLAMDEPELLEGAPPDPIKRGDVLGFLHGAAEIDAAVEHIRSTLKARSPKLAAKTDIYPYHARAEPQILDWATKDKQDESRRRIVIATNAAETSLTIKGLAHVVETGFIKQTQWDPVLEKSPLVPIVHSQAGCRQRWGRVGRKDDGWAWCLYSESQFERIFPGVTQPEIQRSRLDSVLLLAKLAGADRVDARAFPWLDAPSRDEIVRTTKRLQRNGMLDQDGDLSEAGARAAVSGGEDALFARLMADADRFGMGIEAATLIPMMKIGIKELFPFEKDWEPKQQREVREAQSRVRSVAQDDLELLLRVFDGWDRSQSQSHLPADASWRAPKLSKKDLAGLRGRPQDFYRQLTKARSLTKARKLIFAKLGDSKSRQTYLSRVEEALRAAIRETWPRRNGIHLSALKEAAAERVDFIQELGAKKKGMEDRAIDFAGLDRFRAIAVRAHLDQVYVREGQFMTETGRVVMRYQPLDPDETETDPLEIGVASSCYENPPEAILALGPKDRIHNDKEGCIQIAPFIIGVDLAMVEAVRRLDDLQLAEYLRVRCPRPARGSEEDERLKRHERLRAAYPAGSVVEARILSTTGAGVEVEIERSVGWGGVPLPEFGYTEERREQRAFEKEGRADFRDFDAFGKASRRDGKKRSSRSRSASLPEEEVLDIISEESESETESAGAQEARASSQLTEPAVGRLRHFGAVGELEMGQKVVAEVTRHFDITDRPGLLVVSPPVAARFGIFCERYAVGQQIEAEVLGPAPRGAAFRGLQVREIQTGLEVTVPTEELVLVREEVFLEGLSPGAILRLTIDSIDRKAQEVRLTALHLLEQDLKRLHDFAGKQQVQGKVVSIDQDERRVYVWAAVPCQSADGGLAVPVKIKMNRELFEASGELKLPYKLGDMVHLKLKAHKESASRTSIGQLRLEASETKALKAADIRNEAGALRLTGRLSYSARGRILKATHSDHLIQAVRELYRESNALHADWVLSDLEKRYPIGKVTEGKIRAIRQSGLELILPGGVLGRVAIEEVSWHSDNLYLKGMYEFDQVIQATVTGIDLSKPSIDLSVKRMTSDPWKGDGIKKLFPLGSQLVGTVRNVIQHRAWMQFQGGLEGTVHVSGMRSLTRGQRIEDARHVLNRGDRIKVRVTDYEFGKRQLDVFILNREKDVGKKPASSVVAEKKQGDRQNGDEKEPGPNNWLEGEWPWSEVKKWVREEEPLPTAPPSPPPPRRVKLEERSRPSGWRALT